MAALHSAHCGGNISFYSEADGYRFAVPEVCEPGFPNDAHVVSVQGLALADEDGLTAYEAMKATCDAGDDLVLTDKDEGDLPPFTCKASLPAARGTPSLDGLPELPVLAR